MRNAFLIGERIYLRPLDRSDCPTLQTYINDPEVTRTLEAYRPYMLQNEEAWVDSLSQNETQVALAIALKENDRLIGSTDLRGISPKDRKAVFGLMLGAKDEWNKGYGTEATCLTLKYGFDSLNLNRIELRVHATNPYAIRAYAKAGFVHEGTLRQDVYKSGRYLDVHVMSILRAEYDRLCDRPESNEVLTDA